MAGGLVPFDPERVVALRRVGDVVFKRPVRLGDTLRVNGKVLETADVGEEAGMVGFAWNVVNQDDRVVARARVDVLWRRDGAADELDDAYAVNGFVPIPL
jgi:acyl dehydratase